MASLTATVAAAILSAFVTLVHCDAWYQPADVFQWHNLNINNNGNHLSTQNNQYHESFASRYTSFFRNRNASSTRMSSKKRQDVDIGTEAVPTDIRCFQCSSASPEVIVGGAGVHPGIYLSQVSLSSIPVSRECLDPLWESRALKDGVQVPKCDQGICIKIDYNDRVNGDKEMMRLCLPKSRGVFKSLCTEFGSAQAFGTWCACTDNLCNGVSLSMSSGMISLYLLLLVHLCRILFIQ